MDALESIKKRRSIRKYLHIPVEKEKIGNIIEAGRSAPSAGNLQNWKFILVLDEKTRQQVSEACYQQHWMDHAPVHIAICVEPSKTERFYGERGEKFYALQQSGAVIQNMLVTATEQGLGSCWVGAFDEAILKRTLNIPDDVQPQAVITIGYADEQPPVPDKRRIEDLTYFNTWKNKFLTKETEFLREYSAQVRDTIIKAKELAEKTVHKTKNKK